MGQDVHPLEADWSLSFNCVCRGGCLDCVGTVPISYQQIAPVALGGLLSHQDLCQRLVQLIQRLRVDSLMLGVGRAKASAKTFKVTLMNQTKVPCVHFYSDLLKRLEDFYLDRRFGMD